jgi:hypothetical protein
MGKGPPGGRRQADRIDYRTEPRRSVAPDRDRDAARTHAGGMAMMLVERQRRPAFLLLLLAVSSRVATAAVAVDDGSFPSSRHKPPALPQAFVATVNTVATSCFVQCPSNCTGKNVVPSCPMPPDTFNTAQRAYNYHTNQTWKSTYQQGLRQNSSAITDCVSGLSFQLDPFRYPQPHQVCSGFPPGFSRPTMPASGLPLGSPGPFVIPAGASLLPNSSTSKVRNLPVRHWQYRAPFNSSVGGARPAGAGLYRWHVEDYYLDLHTGAPLRITLDESVHWLDHEYKNYTTWDRFSRDYMGLTPLRGAEATGLFDVSQLNCKLMLAPPPPSPLPAVPPAIPAAAAAAADAVHEQVAPTLAVSDGLLEHLRSLRRNGLVTWEASRSKRWGAGATVADVRATVGLPGFKAVGKVLGPASNDDTDVEHRSANTAALPSSWDIRTAHPECIWAKTIIDQGGCGSCVSVAGLLVHHVHGPASAATLARVAHICCASSCCVHRDDCSGRGRPSGRWRHGCAWPATAASTCGSRLSTWWTATPRTRWCVQSGYLLSRRGRSLLDLASASGFDKHRDSISSRFGFRAAEVARWTTSGTTSPIPMRRTGP